MSTGSFPAVLVIRTKRVIEIPTTLGVSVHQFLNLALPRKIIEKENIRDGQEKDEIQAKLLIC